MVVLLWSPRSEACIQLADALGTGRGRRREVVVRDRQRRRGAAAGADVRHRGGAHRGGAGGRQPLASFQGGQPPEQLRRWIDSLLAATAGKLGGGEGRPRRSRSTRRSPRPATTSMPGTSAAAAAYQSILDADPNHAEAKGALRQIGFLERQPLFRQMPSRWPMPPR